MIRLATRDDWPAIAQWRAAHYERMSQRNGLPVCAGARLEDAVWLVVDDGGALLAAISWFDTPPTRTMFDLYWCPGFAGKRAAYVLAATALQFADELGLNVVGDTNISNYEYRALLRRVGFRIYYYDQANDVCYFTRERGLRYERLVQTSNADKRQPSYISAAAAANAKPAHHRAAAKRCAHQ